MKVTTALLALGAAVLGLVALGAASLGHVGLRAVGLALLVVGAASAGTLRWGKIHAELDRASASAPRRSRERPERQDGPVVPVVPSLRSQPEPMIAALESARTAGTLTCDGAKQLVDCYARECGIGRAVTAALQTRAVLGTENCKTVAKAAYDAGAHAAAATLLSALRSDVRVEMGPGGEHVA